MKRSGFEEDKRIEDNIIKDLTKSWRLKKENNGSTLKGIRHLLDLKRKSSNQRQKQLDTLEIFLNQKIKNNYWSNNHIEYEKNE